MRVDSTRRFVSLIVCLAVLVACNRGYKPYDADEPGLFKPDLDPYRSAFMIDKSKLQSTGSNLFFPLQPGTVSTFRDGDESLTITVLEETRTVDGVVTRVVEEREENSGGVKEVSRNFFACDPESGDVYYFGEEVDLYRNGQGVGHVGAWKSGENGARFGLMMPGVLSLGDRFYQERAPGIAMDRCEVVGVSQQILTPVGKFNNAVKLFETTPLEQGSGSKIYAPGIGLVKDGRMEIVSKSP
ncbi:MAG: hypothetical protein ACREJD_01430 [Phycisphaerales bacterium]